MGLSPTIRSANPSSLPREQHDFDPLLTPIHILKAALDDFSLCSFTVNVGLWEKNNLDLH